MAKASQERAGEVAPRFRPRGSARDVEELLDRVRTVPGYVYPFHTYLADHDFTWLQAFQSWYEQLRAERWLPLKYKELLFVTAACLGLHETGMRTHMRKALELGATSDEILETIEVAAHTGGAGVLVPAVRILVETVEGKELPKGPQWVADDAPRAAAGGKSPRGGRVR
jgi:alkylhydroperoxidase/carboxymuconolactone decarboxylase family protein YurZ